MRTVAVLPVKTFGRAKQRLGAAVDDRAQLAEAMAADVLDALGMVRGLDGVIVVTADPHIAGGHGIEVVHDPVEAGQSSPPPAGFGPPSHGAPRGSSSFPATARRWSRPRSTSSSRRRGRAW